MKKNKAIHADGTINCDCIIRFPASNASSPKQLSELIIKIKFAISKKLIQDVTDLAIEHSMSFDLIEANNQWPDIIENDFECMSCGKKFQLFADTYHGSFRNGWSIKN